MADNTNLKPCPFCGGAAQPRHALWPSDGDTDAVIHEATPECGLGDFSIGTADNGMSVAAAWNRRAAVGPMEDVAQGFTQQGERRWSLVLKSVSEELEAVIRAYDGGTAQDYASSCIAFDNTLAALLDRVAQSVASGVREDGNG